MKKLAIALVAACWFGLLFSSLASSYTYDEFNASQIDGSKWLDREFIRAIGVDQRLHLGMAAPHPDKTLQYPVSPANEILFANPESVLSIRTHVTILEGSAQDAAAARTGLRGGFYNDGTPGPGKTGDIIAGIAIEAASDGQYAHWYIHRDTDASGSNPEIIASGIFATPVSIGSGYILRLTYDPDLHRFLFQVDAEEVVFGPAGLPPRNAAARAPEKALFVELQIPDELSPASLFAAFEDVHKNGLPYDDFSAPLLDPSRWNTGEIVRAVEGNRLTSMVRVLPGQTEDVISYLGFADPQSNSQIQVSVTPDLYLNPGGAVARTFIRGCFYNDGTGSQAAGDQTGDVTAEIWIGGTDSYPRAGWTVRRAVDAASETTEILAAGELDYISLGTSYVLSLAWTGHHLEFAVRYNAYEKTAGYTPPGAILAPVSPCKAIGSQVTGARGQETQLRCFFEWVSVDNPSQLQYGQPLYGELPAWDSVTYEIPVQAGKRIFALLYKEEDFSGSLSIESGNSPAATQNSSSDQAIALTPGAGGYAVVRIRNRSGSTHGYRLELHTEQTFPRLPIGQTYTDKDTRKGWRSTWFAIPVEAADAGKNIVVRAVSKNAQTPMGASLRVGNNALPDWQPTEINLLNDGDFLAVAAIPSAAEGLHFVELRSRGFGSISAQVASPESLAPGQTKNTPMTARELYWFQIDAPAERSIFFQIKRPPFSDPSGTGRTIFIEIWDRYGLWDRRTSHEADTMVHLITNPLHPEPYPYLLILRSVSNEAVTVSASASLPVLELNVPRVIPLNADPGWFQVQVPEGLGGVELLLESGCASSSLTSWQHVIGAPGDRQHFSRTGSASNRWEEVFPYPSAFYLRPAVSGCSGPNADYTLTARTYEAPIFIRNESIMAKFDVDRGTFGQLVFVNGAWTDLLDYPKSYEWTDPPEAHLLDPAGDARIGKYLARGWQARSVESRDSYLRMELVHPSGFKNNILLNWSAAGVDIDQDFTAPERIELHSVVKFYNYPDSWWAFPAAGGILSKTNGSASPYTFPSYPVDGSYTSPAEPWVAMWEGRVASPSAPRDIRGFTFSDGVMAKVRSFRNYGLDVGLLLPAGTSHAAYRFRKIPEATYEPIRAKTSAPWITLTTEVDRQFTGPGAELTYTVSARNTGSTPATGVVVEDVLPQNLELVPGSISGGGVYDSGTRRITWSVGELETGQPFQATFKAVVSSGVASGTQITNRAVARCAEVTVPNTANATTTIADPVITGITPNKGGNGGATTVTIRGSCLDPHAAVYLRRAGEPDIVAGMVSGVTDGSSLGATFNLIGKAPGTWDVVVVNAAGGTATLPAGFTILRGGKPQVWVDVIGRGSINVGRTQPLSVVCGNNGDSDAYGVLLWIRIPKEIAWQANFNVNPLPDVPGYPLSMPPEWNSGPIHFDDGGNALIPLFIPRIGANETIPFPFSMKALGATEFEIQAWASEPLASVQPDPNLPGPVVFFNSPAFSQCLGELVRDVAEIALKEALGQLLGNSCGVAVAKFIGSQFEVMVLNEGPYTKYSLAQSLRVAIYAGYKCASDFIPQLKALDVSISLVNVALDVMLTMGPTLESCGGAMNAVAQKSIRGTARYPFDPNDKSGLEGYDPEGTAANERRHLIAGNSPLLYMIQFENLKTASGSVLDMTIVDQLEPGLDWSTFGFDMLQVGTHLVTIPAGSRQFTKTVDFRPELPAVLEITGRFDTETGLAQWSFSAKDPYTGELTEFLPPNVDSVDPKGRGWVTFRVNPRIDLPTGTVIRNKATIDFEIDVPPAPMDTPEWINTIDNSKPSSRVATLDALQSASSFTVNWEGIDAGSGVRDYTIYVSDSDGPFTAWLTNTKLTSGTYTGLPGHHYAFYSLARDNVGNVEDDKAAPEAATTVRVARLAGSGYIYHDNYRGTFQVDASSGQPPSGYLKYYYTRTRMNVVSTAVNAMMISGGTATVAGTCSINGVSGYHFEATIVDGNPDQFGMTIKKTDGGLYYAVPLSEMEGSSLSFR
jgi:uncharacterized repeat protein (TIGR01451 family)